MANPTDSLETREEKILGFLSDDSVKKVVLYGEAGVGKTWMAKKIGNSASLNGSCYGTIWVVRGCNYEGKSLFENIAVQLSVILSNEWGEDDNAEMKQQDQEGDFRNLKWRIQEKLNLMKSQKLDQMKTAKPEEEKTVKVDQQDAPEDGKGPYILLVLDDFVYMDHWKILYDLNDLLREHLFKILITRSGSDIRIGDERNEILVDDMRTYKMKFLSDDESSSLLRNKVKDKVSEATGFGRLSAAIGKRSSGHPGVIIMIAEAMNRVKDFELDKSFEEMASIIESADIETLLQHVYQMLPSTLNKCCWHCRYLFLHHDRIHYNELITHWLLEGYFDHHDHIETAYDEAHHTLMELKGRGFLRGKESSYITMDSDALGVNDHRRDGLSGSAYVGVASVLNDKTWAGLGSVIQTDGMIKTSSKKWDEMSTLFTDGAHFCREFPETFYQHIQRLRVLVILNPMFKKLPSPLSKMEELQVLVLRGSHLLESVDVIHELTNLLVLEISGAHMVKEIRDDLFEHMKDLRSLNLSGVGIKWLPSLLNQSELRWLILRRCVDLERLCEDNLLKRKEAAKQEVFSLAKLEVLDLSGSSSFQDIQIKTFSLLETLQILNLSETKIERLPLLRSLRELTRLLLRDCQSLTKLPPLKQLLKLKILDFSKTTSLKKLQEDPQGSKADFGVLVLPRTDKNKTPPNISSLSHLLLCGWVDLPKLPSTQELQGLEELNLSDASILEEFEDLSFEHLKSLRRLILSNTKIKALPSLSQDSELRLLFLKNCRFLTKLPNLSILKKLEVLDLSGCSELMITSNDSFQGMSRLKTINLSETKIKSLPSLEDQRNLEVLDLCGAKSSSNINLEFLRHMSKLRILNLSELEIEQLPSLSHLTNLRELSLRGCSCEVSNLNALKELELLDLSGAKVESLFNLETFSNLQQLLLGDCADLEILEKLESLTELEVLDLSGTKIKEFPYEISDLTSLRKLNLQNMKHMKEIDWKKIKYIPEEFNLGCCRSPSSEIAESSDWPSISICGTGFFQFVEENGHLWDTCFQKFHFSVWLPKNSVGRMYELGDRGLLRDIRSQERIPHDKEPGRYLEIRGYSCFSSIPEHVLQRADHISLTDVSSLSCVSVQSEVFGDLKHLYIDCCPMLSNIFPSSKLPKKLEILQIKFCEKMERLFNPDIPVECNLQTLDLLQLPKLERIGVMMVPLRVLKVRQCPKLQNLEKVLGGAEKLEILHISYAAELKTICSQEVKPGTLENLKQLKIESCPQLKEVFPLSKLPPKLEILEIYSCESLETIFRGSSAGSSLKRLRLCNLPSLSSTAFKVPPQCRVDFNCPNVQIDGSG